MKIDFTGQTVLVAGAARAIGRGIVQCFDTAGADVFAADRLAKGMHDLPAATRVVDLLDRAALHAWVAFLVVPVFGFANAGVSFAGMSFASLLAPVPLGIALGLFVGKQIGVFGVAWLLIKLRLAHRPDGATLVQLYGVSLLCGIGFTMSLFIGQLAFPLGNPGDQAQVRIGVVMGSLASLVAGMAVIGWSQARRRRE